MIPAFLNRFKIVRYEIPRRQLCLETTPVLPAGGTRRRPHCRHRRRQLGWATVRIPPQLWSITNVNFCIGYRFKLQLRWVIDVKMCYIEAARAVIGGQAGPWFLFVGFNTLNERIPNISAFWLNLASQVDPLPKRAVLCEVPAKSRWRRNSPKPTARNELFHLNSPQNEYTDSWQSALPWRLYQEFLVGGGWAIRCECKGFRTNFSRWFSYLRS